MAVWHRILVISDFWLTSLILAVLEPGFILKGAEDQFGDISQFNDV